MITKPFSKQRRRTRGFSLVELVVASGVGVMVFTVGALAFRVIASQQRVSVNYASVTIGGAAAENYYGMAATVTDIDAHYAPNYGRATTADMLRETFYNDLDQATAVYMLGRDGLTTARPSGVTWSSANDGKSLDTPEAFRLALEASEPLLAGVHNAYTPGPVSGKNLSVYVVQPSFTTLPETLIITAIYEVDIQSVSSPRGTYVTVRRYSFSYMTDVYDVFYPFYPATTDFSPLAVTFERDVRVVSDTAFDDGYDLYRIAKQEPFYFMWWPDPATPTLDTDSLSTSPYSADATDPRNAYFNMGGRTSYMFTVPMFPSL